MTTTESGTYCDKCGGDLTPANLVNAVIVNALLDDGAVHGFHYCKHVDSSVGTKGCATSTVLSTTNLKAFKGRNPDVKLKLFDMDRDLQDGVVGSSGAGS